MSRSYDPKTGKPLQFSREKEIERLIRRIRNSGLLFDEDDAIADKAYNLLGRCQQRLHKWYEASHNWVHRDDLPCWVTKADFM